jgi:hypothetical protein
MSGLTSLDKERRDFVPAKVYRGNKAQQLTLGLNTPEGEKIKIIYCRGFC